MPKPDPALLAEWNHRLAAEGLPEELPLIPRAHRGDATSHYEGDLDAAVLDQPPPQPRPPALQDRVRGRQRPGDRDEQTRLAQDFLRHGEMTVEEREAWMAYAAGVAEREIARRLGRSQRWVRDHLLLPLRERAGMVPAVVRIKRAGSNRFAPRRRNKSKGAGT